MHFIFCMAGLYSRFRAEGYTTPKYLLEWENATILDSILEQLNPSSFSRQVWFLANRRDIAFKKDLEDVVRAHGISPDNISFIADTKGQAETARLAIETFLFEKDRDCPVVFHNIDTILKGRDGEIIKNSLIHYDGYIDIFDADSPAFSYVDIDKEGRVSRIAEKIVISNHATTGLYGFKSANIFLDNYNKTEFSSKERYISDIYAGMDRIVAGPLQKRADFDTIILGTPQEYENEKAKRVGL